MVDNMSTTLIAIQQSDTYPLIVCQNRKRSGRIVIPPFFEEDHEMIYDTEVENMNQGNVADETYEDTMDPNEGIDQSGNQNTDNNYWQNVSYDSGIQNDSQNDSYPDHQSDSDYGVASAGTRFGYNRDKSYFVVLDDFSDHLNNNNYPIPNPESCITGTELSPIDHYDFALTNLLSPIRKIPISVLGRDIPGFTMIHGDAMTLQIYTSTNREKTLSQNLDRNKVNKTVLTSKLGSGVHFMSGSYLNRSSDPNAQLMSTIFERYVSEFTGPVDRLIQLLGNIMTDRPADETRDNTDQEPDIAYQTILIKASNGLVYHCHRSLELYPAVPDFIVNVVN